MPRTSDMQFVLDKFPFESAELTDEHKVKLRALAFDISHTIFISKSEVWLFHLVGSASQSGSDAFNLDLSRRRAESVQKFLETFLPGIPRRFRIIALGEAAPEDKKILENARDRAVGVSARLTGRLPPKIDPIDIDDVIKPRIAPRKDFELQVVSFVTQTIGIGAPVVPIDAHIGRIAMNFIVNDGSTKINYTFKGEGAGSGVSFFFMGGEQATVRGEPQKFKAFARLNAADFAGKGQLSGIFDAFLFGGHERGASRGFHDFPAGSIRPFSFPPSTPGLPSKEEFRGEVTKGFKPLVPLFPAPLPSDGIF